MKAIILLSLLILALAGCGRAGVDPAFDTYVSAFEADARTQHSEARVTYGVEFGNPSEHGCKTNAAGCCDVGFAGWNRVVVVDRKWWDAAATQSDGEASRNAMLYHEFGHCSLGRKHTSAMTQISGPMGSTLTIPESLMNPDVVSGWNFTHNHDAYLEELFKTE